LGIAATPFNVASLVVAVLGGIRYGPRGPPDEPEALLFRRVSNPADGIFRLWIEIFVGPAVGSLKSITTSSNGSPITTVHHFGHRVFEALCGARCRSGFSRGEDWHLNQESSGVIPGFEDLDPLGRFQPKFEIVPKGFRASSLLSTMIEAREDHPMRPEAKGDCSAISYFLDDLDLLRRQIDGQVKASWVGPPRFSECGSTGTKGSTASRDAFARATSRSAQIIIREPCRLGQLRGRRSRTSSSR
jgi:hypothetical protein